EEVNREAGRAKQTISAYHGLSTMGQLATGLVPIAALELRAMETEIAAVRANLGRPNLHEMREAVGRLEESHARMKQQFQLLAATGSEDRRRAIDVIAEIRAFKQVVEPSLRENHVDLKVAIQDQQLLRIDMRPEKLFCLLQILTANSLDWLRGVDGASIRIKL